MSNSVVSLSANMVNTCIVFGCNFSYSRRKKQGKLGVSIHAFPTRKKTREAWVKAVRRDNWQPTAASGVCSQHFHSEDMDCTGQTRRLREGAVPSLFPAYLAHLQKSRVAPRKPSKPKSIASEIESNNSNIMVATGSENRTIKCATECSSELKQLTPRKQKLLEQLNEKSFQLCSARKNIKTLQGKDSLCGTVNQRPSLETLLVQYVKQEWPQDMDLPHQPVKLELTEEVMLVQSVKEEWPEGEEESDTIYDASACKLEPKDEITIDDHCIDTGEGPDKDKIATSLLNDDSNLGTGNYDVTKNMGRKCRGMRGNWDSNMMEKAMTLLQKGKSQRYVANHCGIPRRTLRNHIKSGSTERKLGKKGVLSREQELELEKRIIRFSENGLLPLTPQILRRCVFTFVEKNNIPHPFNMDLKMAGREWYHAFMKRHPRFLREMRKQ